MRLPLPGEPRSEADRGPVRWLTVGPGPAAGLARRPPAGVVAEHAAGVHEALGALSARPFDRVLVAAGALTSRPRAARAVDAGIFAEGCLARLQHPGRIAGYLMRTLAEASDASRVSLMLTDGAGRSLVLRAGRGLDPALLHKVRVPIGVGVAGRAA